MWLPATSGESEFSSLRSISHLFAYKYALGDVLCNCSVMSCTVYFQVFSLWGHVFSGHSKKKSSKRKLSAAEPATPTTGMYMCTVNVLLQ